MDIYSHSQKKNILIFLILILGGILLYSFIRIFTGVIGAVVIYTTHKNIYLYFVEKLRWKSVPSALLVMFFSFLLLVLPVTLVSWLMVDKLLYYQDHREVIEAFISRLDKASGLKFTLGDHLIEELFKIAKKYALGTFSSAINGVLNTLLMVSIMYFLLFFMFTKHKTFEETLIRYMPFSREITLRFGREFRNSTYSNILGQGIIALVQGSLVGLGFWIFGLEDAIFYGVVSVILSFLPLLGAALVYIPAGLYLISMQDKINGIGLLIWGIVLVSNIDNLIRLIINKQFADTHPIITVIGIIIGIPLFGVIGIVLGPLLMSYFILLIKVYETTYIDKELQ